MFRLPFVRCLAVFGAVDGDKCVEHRERFEIKQQKKFPFHMLHLLLVFVVVVRYSLVDEESIQRHFLGIFRGRF